MDAKQRKQLSPEALQKLAMAREKALQVRLKNKLAREKKLVEEEKLVAEPEETEVLETVPGSAIPAIPGPVLEPEGPKPGSAIPEGPKPEPKKIVPDTSDDEKEIARPEGPKKVKKKSNRSKIIISNDSSSSDDDDTPVVYIKTKKKE